VFLCPPVSRAALGCTANLFEQQMSKYCCLTEKSKNRDDMVGQKGAGGIRRAEIQLGSIMAVDVMSCLLN